MAASSQMHESDLGEIGPDNAANTPVTTDIKHMMERDVGDSICINDSELSEIGSGVGPNELQKIAVRYFKVPQPAIDTYKASAR